MDFIIQYWNEKKMEVEGRYLNSVFLGHATHTDLVKSYYDGLKDLDHAKTIQVSMDGPNVNWAFFESLQSKRKLEELPELLDFGSCNLHVVHGAFKTRAEKTTWDLKKRLKALFYLLHDTSMDVISP